MSAVATAAAEAMSIGTISRSTGVHIETIRYYERIGMVPAPPRTQGGRRVYGQHQARMLAFVRRARELGFSLDEIRALVALNASERASCADVREIAGRHLDSVRAKLADLARLEAILAETVARCSDNRSSACPVLDMLDRGEVG